MAQSAEPTPAIATDPSGAVDWGILKDIPFRLIVEIGRTKMRVRDILNLDVGALVITTKLSGEPMDISLDDEIFGRAEIIIIKDKLWARLTKIAREEA